MKGLRPLQASPELFFRYVTVCNPLFGEGFFASLRRAYAASPLHTLAWGDRMTIRLKPMLVAVAIPLGVGALGALASRGGMATLAALQRPPLMPPGWVFPVVWTALYIAMGVASYLIATSGAPRESRRMALCAYGVSLVLSALWPVFFFALGLPLLAFIDLMMLWLMLRHTLLQYVLLRRSAAHWLFPTLLWTTFAGYLNLGIWLLNR